MTLKISQYFTVLFFKSNRVQLIIYTLVFFSVLLNFLLCSTVLKRKTVLELTLIRAVLI
jgi:hypothetical protein